MASTSFKDGLEILQLCRDAGIDVNGVNVNVCTALHVVAGTKHHQAVSFLLQHGADKTIVNGQGDIAFGMSQDTDQVNTFMKQMIEGANLPESFMKKRNMEKVNAEMILETKTKKKKIPRTKMIVRGNY